MNRRRLFKGAALGAVGAAVTAPLAAPAIGQGIIEWRLVHAWQKGLPGVGTGVDRLAANIQAMSGGRLRLRVFAAGELVPALRCMDAVMDGTA